MPSAIPRRVLVSNHQPLRATEGTYSPTGSRRKDHRLIYVEMSALSCLGILRTSCLNTPARTTFGPLSALRGILLSAGQNFQRPHASLLHTLRPLKPPSQSHWPQFFSSHWHPVANPARITRNQSAKFSLSHVLRATWRDQKSPPPPPRFKGKPVGGLRAFVDRMNPSYIVFAFLGIYGSVFLAWTLAKGRAVSQLHLSLLRYES